MDQSAGLELWVNVALRISIAFAALIWLVPATVLLAVVITAIAGRCIRANSQKDFVSYPELARTAMAMLFGKSSI